MKQMIKAGFITLVTCMLMLTINTMNALASSETEMEICDLTLHSFCDRDLLPTQYVELIAPPNHISFLLLKNDAPGDRNGQIENDDDSVTYSASEKTTYLATFSNSEDITKRLKISNTDAITESPQHWTFYHRPAQVVKLVNVFAANKN
ncbi:hypothetical protein [Moorena sp. SIO4G3]|uniref:hypothetical protein n=1 Tax=Moorena sp. SIO4G3 TaxID=2607821 RepID=UPI00142BC569|nr:hypothetical protein [Moorena sp. SIO4G3]NEO78572.1 hypothetical protein [Moorena sp. SIO4G3]